ncbi:MAG: arylamine N-acetyltransferase [Bacteroidota bacterium]|nr:arylamine N-acetyltransferase [Bacteroidota bacterium]MDP4231305.1 arylamine N-acetyltransferase [Bacteroidota bacterium]MDP4235892.1 arylamine N-acetyltransferase [Bacteroidota bacterium]
MIEAWEYLGRIGVSTPPSPDLDSLSALHIAHLVSVPFETYDIHSAVPIVCDEESFVHKIVKRKRGGFCYELNTSFAWLLRQLGFDVTLLSGRVTREGGGFGPEFDHMALLVQLDQPYIVDVGFTNFSTKPLTLDGAAKSDPLGSSKIELQESGDHAFMRLEEGKWKIEYLFTLQPRQLEEFAEMCKFHETSPQSPFIAKPLSVIYTESGRITISGNSFIAIENGIKTTHEIQNSEKIDLLRNYFKIDLCQ